MTIDELKRNKGLSGSEHLTADEVNLFLDLEDENSRRGNFCRIFPVETNVKYFE